MITQDELKANGWKRFKWNGGIIIEWWKPIIAESFESRIGVRFGEYRGRIEPIVYLFAGNSYLPLTHIKTYEHLETLYRAIYNPSHKPLRDFVLEKIRSEQGERR